jgi:hypothetical protein
MGNRRDTSLLWRVIEQLQPADDFLATVRELVTTSAVPTVASCIEAYYSPPNSKSIVIPSSLT